MLYLSLEGKPLFLPSGAIADLEHINPLFADGIEDSFSLPFEVPARHNEEVFAHVHNLHLQQRTLSFPNARLGNQGVPLHTGTLHVLSTTPQAIRTSYSVDGWVASIKDVQLPDTLKTQVFDLAELEYYQLFNLPTYANGGAFQFPMHRNIALYGDANTHWYPNANEFSATQAYQVNDLVSFTTYDPVERTDIYQCTENTTAAQSPTTHPDKWRKAAFGIANAWNRDEGDFYFNTTHNYHSFVPWFYLKWVLRESLRFLGYTAQGSFFDDPASHNLLLPCSTTIDRATEPTDENLFRAHQDNASYQYTPGTNYLAFRMPAQVEMEDPDDAWDNDTFQWTCNAPGIYRFRISGILGNPTPPTWNNQPRYVRCFMVRENNTYLTFNTVLGVTVDQGLAFTAFITVTMTAGNVGQKFHFACLQMWAILNWSFANWPTTEAHHWVHTAIAGWQLEDATPISIPDNFIQAHRHVPDVPLSEFIMAIADACCLEVVPDMANRTVSFNHKDRVLLPGAPRTSISHMQTGTIEIDHQRATPAIALQWDLQDNLPVDDDIANATIVHSEEDLEQPDTQDRTALIASTREVLKSRFSEDIGDYYWQPIGHHVPPAQYGTAPAQQPITPKCKPLHMVQLSLDGKEYLVPDMPVQGTSAFFHTKGDRSTIWLCEYKPMASSDGTVTNVPGARSWGLGWDDDDRALHPLLWNDPAPDLPGMGTRHWKRWADMLTTAEPITTDLVLDMPFILQRTWRGMLHLHGHNMLVQRMPVQYGTDRGPIMARGTYLLRLRSTLLPPPTEEPENPHTPCEGEGTATMQISVPFLLNYETSTGYIAYRDSMGNVTVDDTTFLFLDAGTYCFWASDAEGEPDGTVTNLLFIAFDLPATAQLQLTGLTDLAGLIVSNLTLPDGINISTMQALIFLGASGCGLATLDLSGGHPALKQLELFGNDLDQTSVDQAFIVVAANDIPASHVNTTNGTNAVPSSASDVARADIVANGGTALFNT